MFNETTLINEIYKYLKNVYKLHDSQIDTILKKFEETINEWSKLEQTHLSPNLMADEIMEVLYSQE